MYLQTGEKFKEKPELLTPTVKGSDTLRSYFADMIWVCVPHGNGLFQNDIAHMHKNYANHKLWPLQ